MPRNYTAIGPTGSVPVERSQELRPSNGRGSLVDGTPESLELTSYQTGFGDGRPATLPEESGQFLPGAVDLGQAGSTSSLEWTIDYVQAQLDLGGAAGARASAELGELSQRDPRQFRELLVAAQRVLGTSPAPVDRIAVWISRALASTDPVATLGQLAADPGSPEPTGPSPSRAQEVGTPSPNSVRARVIRNELAPQIQFLRGIFEAEAGSSGRRANAALDELLQRSPEDFAQVLALVLDMVTTDTSITNVAHIVSAALRVPEPMQYLVQSRAAIRSQAGSASGSVQIAPMRSSAQPVSRSAASATFEPELPSLPAMPAVDREKLARDARAFLGGTVRVLAFIGRSLYSVGAAVAREMAESRARARNDPPEVGDADVNQALGQLQRGAPGGARTARAVAAYLNQEPRTREIAMFERRLVRVLNTEYFGGRDAPDPAEYLGSFIAAAVRSSSPDAYLQDLEALLALGGLSFDALVNLGAKALRGHLEPGWLATTGLPMEWIDFMALDPSTPWRALIEGTQREQVRDDKWMNSAIKGLAGELVAQEALLEDRRYGQVLSRQTKITNTEADFLVGRSERTAQGVEVKAWDPSSWKSKLDAYELLLRDRPLSSSARTQALQFESLLRQLGDLHSATGRPAVLAYADDLTGAQRNRLEDLVLRASPNAQFVRLSRSRIEEFEQALWDGLLANSQG